jgi:uncharacterized protein YgiM (DUF1202 family)
MKNLITILFTLITIAGFSQSYNGYDYTSSYTTESKSCGHCGHAVANNSTVGMKCPYCGVVWGRENTSYSTSYTTTIPSSGTATTATAANLRNGPSTDYGVICQMPANTSLTILDKSGYWVKVSYVDYSGYYGAQTRIGWVYYSLLSF